MSMFGNRKEPIAMHEPPADIEVAKALSAFQNLQANYEAVCGERDRLRSDLDVANREIDILREQLHIAATRRDVSYRHSNSLMTTMLNLLPQIDSMGKQFRTALENAKIEATSGGAVETQEPRDLDAIDEGVAKVVANLKTEHSEG